MSTLNVIKKLVAALVLGLSIPSVADVRASLFSKADAIMEQAQTANAEILAPVSYSRALKEYQSAQKRYEAGGDIGRIERQLTKAVNFAGEALSAAKVAEVKLATAFDARQDALEVGANEVAADTWSRASKSFEQAAENLEEGDAKKISGLSQRAESEFREAELIAIKAKFLDETRALLEQADDKKVDRYAPQTLTKAKALLGEAETALEQNRYDRDQPRSLAKEANYTVRHAMYIADQLHALKKKHMTPEEMYLSLEQPLGEVAAAADLVADFSMGSEETKNDLTEYVNNAQRAYRELENSQIRIAKLEAELSGVAKESQTLKKQMAREAEIEAKFKSIAKMFAQEEADVFRQENKVILRLVGLNFPSGAATIETQFYGLLGKVERAMNTFPNSKIVIEGHTDSYGGDEVNLRLSERRANAVREYLLVATKKLSSDVLAVGYGEARPVANNETAEGRQKNRRIDLVLDPAL